MAPVLFAATQAVRHFSRPAVFVTAEDAPGALVHIVVAMGSPRTLMRLSDLIRPLLQIAGGLSLIYLDIRTVRTASVPSRPRRAPTARPLWHWSQPFSCLVTMIFSRLLLTARSLSASMARPSSATRS